MNSSKIVYASWQYIKSRPSIFIWSALLWIVLYAISYASASLALSIQTNTGQALWLALVSIITIFISGFYGWKLISMQSGKGDGWLRGTSAISASLIVIAGIYALGLLIVNKISFVLSSSLNLPLIAAQVVFFLLYLAFLLGPMLFLTAMPFISVMRTYWILAAAQESFKFVRKNYALILGLCLVLYALSQAISLTLPPLASGLINTVIGTPIFITLITESLQQKS